MHYINNIKRQINESFQSMTITESEVGKIHIGTDTKRDMDYYFEPRTGKFHVNVIDAAGNRWNRLNVNTIDDILAKVKTWKWTDKGEELFPEAIEEASTTAGVPGYQTPYAFGKGPDDDTIEAMGYKKATIKKKHTANESSFMKMSKELHINEASYAEYKSDPSMSSKAKLNTAIKDINSNLYQVERFLKQNRKLREEENLGTDNYWKSTALKLVKMNERLNRLQEELKQFGLEEIVTKIVAEEKKKRRAKKYE